MQFKYSCLIRRWKFPSKTHCLRSNCSTSSGNFIIFHHWWNLMTIYCYFWVHKCMHGAIIERSVFCLKINKLNSLKCFSFYFLFNEKYFFFFSVSAWYFILPFELWTLKAKCSKTTCYKCWNMNLIVEKSTSVEYRCQISSPKTWLLANEFQFMLSVARDVVEFENAQICIICNRQAIFLAFYEVWLVFGPIQGISHAVTGIPPEPAVCTKATVCDTSDVSQAFKNARLFLTQSEKMIGFVFWV